MKVDRESEKFDENLYKNLRIKLALFREGHEFSFLMSSIYAHQVT